MSLPERVGRLRRLDRLGEGAFSSVWLYRDDELRSDVAVKALADNWAQRMDVRERFLEEARILRAADSDHVVRVYDVGEAGGTPYFVMTYADRGTLADLLAEGPLSLERVVTLVRQAGDGLSVLHAKGVVHRDIKPQNLLLASDGLGRERLMVADLGVAKALLHASGLTQVVGTPAYMAPEQALGGGIDERADVHGLAAVAYHLLTGQLAREGSVSDLVRATLPAPPSSYVDLDPEVGAAVDAAILRGLEPDREDRWPDVQSLVDALAACAPDAPVTIYGDRPRNGRPYRSAAVTRARRQSVILLAWCVVVALAMFGASYAVVSLLQ